MATATSAFAPLSTPVHEDTMDMSSPAHRQSDNDIDIDIDFTYNDDTLVVDDQMLDDDETRPHTATDTAMDDNAEQDLTLVQEADMADGPPAEIPDEPVLDAPPEEDDELIDYGDDDYIVDEQLQDAVLEEADVAPTDAEMQQQQQRLHNKQEADGTMHESGYVSKVSQQAVVPVDLNHASMGARSPASTQGDYQQAGSDREASPGEYNNAVEAQIPSGAPEAVRGDVIDDSEAVEAAVVIEAGVDETLASVSENTHAIFVNTSGRRASEGPATPTDTGLHHMILQFGESEIPLFRSRGQPEGLLTNDNLVGHHLSDLISNCKERLHETGRVVFSDNQECTLRFQGLPLKLRESSKAAYKCTLNDVLNVYLHLHHNASTEPVPPLFLTLTTPENFTDMLQSLKVAAESGQGIPDVPYPEDEDVEEQYFPEVGELDDEEDCLQQDLYNDRGENGAAASQSGDSPVEGDSTNYEGQYEIEETSGGDGLEHEDTEQEEVKIEASNGELDAQKELPKNAPEIASTASANLEALHADDHLSGPQVLIQEQAVHVARNSEVNVASPASSETMQTAHELNTTGEYDSDLGFGWDVDEALISEISDATGEPKITEPTVVEHSSEAEELQPTDAVNADTITVEEDGAFRGVLQDHSPASGDEYEEVGDYDYDIGAEEETDDHGEDHELGGQDDQADTYDGQHTEFQPVEEEEQYHIPEDEANEPESENEINEQEYADDNHSQAGVGSPEAADTFDDPNEVIDFDDDTPAEHEARKGSPLVAAIVAPDSPLGKRSFDEHLQEDLYDDDEPELKKARAG